MAWGFVDSDGVGFADGGSGHVYTIPDGAPASGELDILCVGSNTTVTSVTASGTTAFTKRREEVTNQGAYIYSRKATGDEGSTITITTNGDHKTALVWLRFTGNNGFDKAAGAQANGSSDSTTPALNTGALAEVDELAISFAALHNFSASVPVTPQWSAGYPLGGSESASQGSAGESDAVVAFVAYRTDAGTAAETPNVTFTNTARNRYMLFAAFTQDAAVTVHGAAAVTLGALGVVAAGKRTVHGAAAVLLGALGVRAVPGAQAASAGNAGRGWGQALSLLHEAQVIAAAERARPVLACPNDGEPLRTGAGGTLFCPFDGWTPDRF